MDTEARPQTPPSKPKMNPRYRMTLLLLVCSILILLNEISDLVLVDPYTTMVLTPKRRKPRKNVWASTPASHQFLNSTTYTLTNISRPKMVQREAANSLEKVTAAMPKRLNVTSKTGRILVYNRVPKCGSTTMLRVLSKLAHYNKYSHRSSKLYHHHQLTQHEQDVLELRWIRYLKRGYHSYDRHMYYFNMTRSENFIWINFIRDPVERFVSEFYFMRSPARWAKPMMKKQKRPPKSWFTMKLETCVLAEHPECLPDVGHDHELQLTYFCGQHPECRVVGSRWALQQAKENVERYYSVVGLLEEMLLSLQVLQSYIPRFFNNVTHISTSLGLISTKMNEDKTKPLVSGRILSVLRSRLGEDNEFYDFIRQRLHLQAAAIGVQVTSIGASEDMAELKHL
ncbi:unnamed protein product, partial [Meganyctiphanes norvegica]